MVKEFKARWPKETVVAVTIEQRRHELMKEVSIEGRGDGKKGLL